METDNRIFPLEAGVASEPIALTMDLFRPVEPPHRSRMDSEPAPKDDRLPYAWQDPRGAARVAITTPGGSYESDSFHIDEAMGEIVIDADGIRILLDGRNVVVYLDTKNPTIYRNTLCDVTLATKTEAPGQKTGRRR